MSLPIGDLLPQTGTARLLTALSRCDGTSVTVVGAIPSAHPLVCDGAAPAFLAIEIGAQAAAAMESMTRPAGHGPVRGRLVRVRAARFSRATLPANAPLAVTARRTALAPPLAVYEISVCLDGVESVTATLSTYATAPPGAP